MNSEIRTIVQKNHNAVTKELETLKSESFMCYGQVIAPGVKIYSDLPSNLKKQGITDDAKIAKLCSPVSVQEGETLVLRTVYAESPDIGGKDYVWMKCYIESPDVNGREFQWMKCYSIKSDTAAVHMRYVQVRNLATDKPLVGNISLFPPTLAKSLPSSTTTFLKNQSCSGSGQRDSSDRQQQQENESDQGEEGEEISKAEDFSNVIFQAPFDIART